MKKEYKSILKKSSLLIVEDNYNLRVKFITMLSKYFEYIYEASNGDEAIEIFNRVNPNVIITDVKMPKTSGVTLTSFIRRFNKDIPIVVISGYGEKETLKELISLNLVSFLEKPIDYEELKSVLINCAKVLIERGLIEFNLANNIKYSFSKKCLIVNEEPILLGNKEILFLELLIKNRHQVISKELVEEKVYDREEMSSSAISNLILRIRKKTKLNIITTIPNVGFILSK